MKDLNSKTKKSLSHISKNRLRKLLNFLKITRRFKIPIKRFEIDISWPSNEALIRAVKVHSKIKSTNDLINKICQNAVNNFIQKFVYCEEASKLDCNNKKQNLEFLLRTITADTIPYIKTEIRHINASVSKK